MPEEKWLPIVAEIIRVEHKDGQSIVEFRDEGLQDTTILGFSNADFREENGQCFVRLGAKTNFIKIAADIDVSSCPVPEDDAAPASGAPDGPSP